MWARRAGPAKCFARDRRAASGVGVNVPLHNVPFACNARSFDAGASPTISSTTVFANPLSTSRDATPCRLGAVSRTVGWPALRGSGVIVRARQRSDQDDFVEVARRVRDHDGYPDYLPADDFDYDH